MKFDIISNIKNDIVEYVDNFLKSKIVQIIIWSVIVGVLTGIKRSYLSAL